MILLGRHTLTYRYDRPVFIEPMCVRLRPRCDAKQHLSWFSLEVEPPPAGQRDSIDFHGNDATLLWFDGLRDRLQITTHWKVETLCGNPFDFLISEPGWLTLPLADGGRQLRGFDLFSSPSHPHPSVEDYARRVLEEAGEKTLNFLSALAGNIQQDVKSIIRDEGDALAPEETLRRGEGACRDHALLFMEICRFLGLPARFVSGYKALATQERSHLHAWAQVFLPGAGWIGFDPSLGVAAGDEYVVIAAGPHPDDAAPTTGSFRGSGARGDFEFDIEIEARP